MNLYDIQTDFKRFLLTQPDGERLWAAYCDWYNAPTVTAEDLTKWKLVISGAPRP